MEEIKNSEGVTESEDDPHILQMWADADFSTTDLFVIRCGSEKRAYDYLMEDSDSVSDVEVSVVPGLITQYNLRDKQAAISHAVVE